MLQVSFLLIGEGSADAALVSHLEELCLRCGADEVSGVAPDLALLPKVGHRVVEKLRAGLQLEPAVDLVFLHRDSDHLDANPRRGEIMSALQETQPHPPGIPLVPVQETEAWLILDEAQIRLAADNPNGRADLEIPRPEEVESIAQPKELLFNLLRVASELTGRRLRRFERTLPRRKRRLVEELRCDGPVSRVAAWQRLRADVEEVLSNLVSNRT